MNESEICWRRAASFAARAHRHQVRKDGETPYVAHVYRVAMTVRDVFECDDRVAICAALLHDTIEDTTVDFDELQEAFGENVARCVAALTKNAALPEPQREREYDEGLAKADWRARLIKLADALDNFADSATAGQRAKALKRCQRAVSLASADTEPCVRRAMEIVSREAGLTS